MVEPLMWEPSGDSFVSIIATHVGHRHALNWERVAVAARPPRRRIYRPVNRPKRPANEVGLRAASAMVRTLKERFPDLVILPAHDPSAAERLCRANGAPDGTLNGGIVL